MMVTRRITVIIIHSILLTITTESVRNVSIPGTGDVAHDSECRTVYQSHSCAGNPTGIQESVRLVPRDGWSLSSPHSDDQRNLTTTSRARRLDSHDYVGVGRSGGCE